MNDPAYISALEAVLDAARPVAAYLDGYAYYTLAEAIAKVDKLRQPIAAPTLASLWKQADYDE